jgi:predicted ATPase
MIHLRSARLGAIDAELANAFPFSVPVIKALAGGELAFTSEVTFLVGENGSGKSTLLEALACAAGSITVGSESAERDSTLAPVRALARQLKLSWNARKHTGFFMRSEDFFGFVKWNRDTRAEYERELETIDQEFAGRSELARGLAKMPLQRELADMTRRYGADLDANSHGESYFTLFKSRFVPNGLYLLDEPEAPLSPMRQVGLLALIKTMVEEQGAQYIIATHSPVLMAYPGAAIYSFDSAAIQPVAYDDVEHVAFTRAFLNAPQRFLRHL